MCKYCDMTEVNIEYACDDYFIHKSFRLQDDFNGKVIGNSESYPYMYLREYRNTPYWEIVMEFADDAGTVLRTQAVHCPKCGRKLNQMN